MNISDLKAVGKYLYGGGWQSALAEDLGINVRSVQRWVARDNPIPAGAWQEIIELAAEKQFAESLPIIQSIAEKHGLPEVIDLYVYPDDSNVISQHPRTWSYETDLEIKSKLAEMLCDYGIPAQVVER